MISVLNRFMHGYVICPVLLSFSKRGFFNTPWDNYGMQEFSAVHSFNTGHFKAALKIFESLGWVTVRNGRYTTAASMPDFGTVHSGINFFYELPLYKILSLHEYALADTVGSFKPAEWHSLMRSIPNGESLMAGFIQSVVVIPLLYIFKKKGFVQNEQVNIRELDEDSTAFITCIFDKAGLGEAADGAIRLSVKGVFLANNIQKAGVVLSYYKLLEKMDQLLFGDAFAVFENNEVEIHLDRTLNVIGSGEQHSIFFDDLSKVVSKLCADPQFVQSLKIVDTGCGDGSLLSRLYHTITTGDTTRCQPTVIGVDLNKEALVQASKLLSTLPHELLTGNIAEPARILEQLEVKGYKKEEMLHVRTFLDHNCPLAANSAEGAADEADETGRPGVFVGDRGEEISSTGILRNYVEHFKKWRQVVSNKGLLTLEVFSLEPATVNKYLEETESLHFDSIHSFSKQYLLPAPDYLISAAAAGLIAQANSFKKYPRMLPYTRISLQHFLPKEYTIHHPAANDVDTLLGIEADTLPPELHATREQISLRVFNDRTGIYVMEKGGELAGVLYSQRITSEAELYQMEYHRLESFYNPAGKFIQIISLQVLPAFQGKGLSNELLSFGLLHNFLKSNVKKVVGLSRCARYTPGKGAYQAYVHAKNKMGFPVDPILNFHFEEGAEIVGPVANYRAADESNLGNGVHIRYQYGDWISKKETA